MSNYQHILFPVDFSPQTDAIIPYVAAMARQWGAKVTLFSVVPPIWLGPGQKPEFASELESATRARLHQALTAEKHDPAHGMNLEHVVRSGEPADEIIRFVQEQSVGLVMMPTHGCGRFRSLLLGSITAKVLHDAPCPVWTAAHALEQRAGHVPKKILCCVDGTPASVNLIRHAGEWSERFHAALELLHVLTPNAGWEGFAAMQTEERAAVHILIRKFFAEAGVECPVQISVGQIAPAVAQRAAEYAADLLIIGRGKIDAPLGRLRTHVGSMIQSAPCPVLSL